MKPMAEIWKPMPDWEGEYEISNLGRVRSCKIVQPFDMRGYRMVRLSGHKKGVAGFSKNRAVFIHRMMLRAFVGEPQEGQQTCHFNGDRKDNRLENLRWDTPVGNYADKKRHGATGGFFKFDADAVRAIRRGDLSITDAVAKYGVAKGTAYRVRRGDGWVGIW
jgi:hypothetical protein